MRGQISPDKAGAFLMRAAPAIGRGSLHATRVVSATRFLRYRPGLRSHIALVPGPLDSPDCSLVLQLGGAWGRFALCLIETAAVITAMGQLVFVVTGDCTQIAKGPIMQDPDLSHVSIADEGRVHIDQKKAAMYRILPRRPPPAMLTLAVAILLARVCRKDARPDLKADY